MQNSGHLTWVTQQHWVEKAVLPIHTSMCSIFVSVSKWLYCCQLFGICNVHDYMHILMHAVQLICTISESRRAFHHADMWILKRHILSYSKIIVSKNLREYGVCVGCHILWSNTQARARGWKGGNPCNTNVTREQEWSWLNKHVSPKWLFRSDMFAHIKI